MAVTKMETTDGVTLLSVQGLSELVRGTRAAFLDGLDEIEVFDPATASLVADDSPSYRRARLWHEATARKTPIPLADRQLTVSTEALATQLVYQQSAALKALQPDNLRPGILLADAVGLGKTLEIGMILAELARRGRTESPTASPTVRRTSSPRARGWVRRLGLTRLASTFPIHVVLAPADHPLSDEDDFHSWCARRSLIELDRSRPLWRLNIVPELPGGKLSVLLVLHHAVVDGLRGVKMITSLLEPTPDDRVNGVARRPKSAPTGRELVADKRRRWEAVRRFRPSRLLRSARTLCARCPTRPVGPRPPPH
jgi:hypothetical protein